MIEELQAEKSALRARIAEIDREILAIQFEGVPRYSEGDLVIVPRQLFGKIKQWPAKIGYVNLSYSSGTMRDGEPWENKTVSYGVFLQQADGTYGGSSKGYYHAEVQKAPE
jgi:hypothetical protein